MFRIAGYARTGTAGYRSSSEIRRNQTEGLQRLGTVSAMVRGSPDDAEDAIEAQAVAAKADYYVITMIDETIITGQWYAQGILYRK